MLRGREWHGAKMPDHADLSKGKNAPHGAKNYPRAYIIQRA